MSERNILLLLEDMLEAALRIRRYNEDLDFDRFMNDDKTRDATIRNFEIIGEAASSIDLKFRETHPEITWTRIRGFRNRIVHDYFGIDYHIVWSIVQDDVDDLTRHLDSLIAHYGEAKG